MIDKHYPGNIVNTEYESFQDILRAALKVNATDIHLSKNLPVFFRINGHITTIDQMPVMDKYQLSECFNTLYAKSGKKYHPANEYDFGAAFDIDGLNVQLRCNAYKVTDYNSKESVYNIAVRILHTHIPHFNELYLPEQLKNLINISYGLVLISGPTGSGKSTTLASLVDLINSTYNYHIITIEDPIEYRHTSQKQKSLINQREVYTDTESFETALRAALREDPDVIVLGELRDKETLRTAIWAAETGHLVFATIHAGSVVDTIDKIVQYFPGEEASIRYSLSNSIKAVISQKLLPKKNCPNEKICCCEVLLEHPVVKLHIRNGEFLSLNQDMQFYPGMMLMKDVEDEYRKLNKI